MSDKKPTHIEREPHELDGLRGICNYRGNNVTKLIGKGYSIWGLYCETPEDVDEAIKLAGESLERSIVYPVTVNGGFECQNTEKL